MFIQNITSKRNPKRESISFFKYGISNTYGLLYEGWKIPKRNLLTVMP